jgi:hypothetical protein
MDNGGVNDAVVILAPAPMPFCDMGPRFAAASARQERVARLSPRGRGLLDRRVEPGWTIQDLEQAIPNVMADLLARDIPQPDALPAFDLGLVAALEAETTEKMAHETEIGPPPITALTSALVDAAIAPPRLHGPDFLAVELLVA